MGTVLQLINASFVKNVFKILNSIHLNIGECGIIFQALIIIFKFANLKFSNEGSSV